MTMKDSLKSIGFDAVTQPSTDGRAWSLTWHLEDKMSPFGLLTKSDIQLEKCPASKGLPLRFTAPLMASNLRLPGDMRLLKTLWSGDGSKQVANDAPPARKDSRIDCRLKTKSPMKLSWQDSAGNRYSLGVRTLDMNSQGARVESPEPMAPGLYVLLEAPKLKLMGSAIVRHCGRRGSSYHIGLDFRNSLTKSF